MFDAGRRPIGRFFYWWVTMVMITGSGLTASGAAPVPRSGAATTTIADTVYLADGSTAQGSLIITWPAFVPSSGAAVAGGTTNTALGANGALSVALVPNAGATPAEVYYTVVYQLGPGEVRTEYWVVPATSPAQRHLPQRTQRNTESKCVCVTSCFEAYLTMWKCDLYPTSSPQVSRFFFTRAMN
jgi:hypothetical protein